MVIRFTNRNFIFNNIIFDGAESDIDLMVDIDYTDLVERTIKLISHQTSPSTPPYTALKFSPAFRQKAEKDNNSWFCIPPC
jgi:hypothetical protein